MKQTLAVKKSGEAVKPATFLILAGAIVTMAAVIRFFCALNDLWLDELVSLNIAALADSPWDVFGALHLDNNHYLNTLYIWWVGVHGNWPGYRIPSLIAGCGVVILAGLIGRQNGRTGAIFAMLLVGLSYVLVLYSSEARGYSTAHFFSFLAYYLLKQFLENRRWQFALLFSASLLLGILSHLTCVSVLLAGLVFLFLRLKAGHASSSQLAQAIIFGFALPVMGLVALYLVDLRQIVAVGGTETGFLINYGAALSWTLGIYPTAGTLPFWVIAAVGLLAIGMWILRRENSGEWLFYLGVIAVFPVLLTLSAGSTKLYVRYFVIGIAFSLLLLSHVLTWLFRKGRGGKTVCLLFLAAYLSVNGWHIASLIKYGRGHYAEAAKYLVQQSEATPVTIGCDHEFRIPFTLQFYLHQMPLAKAVECVTIDSTTKEGPEWYIGHNESSAISPAPPKGLVTIGGNLQYNLVKTYPSAPLSGLHWHLYHRQK